MSLFLHFEVVGSARAPSDLAERSGFGARRSLGRLALLFGMVSWAGALAGCAVDDRTLHGESEGSTDHGGSSAGAGVAGNSSSGSANHGGSDTQDTAGAAGVEGGGGPPTGSPDCVDLDHNGVSDCQETLAKNGSFDKDFADWISEVNISEEWQNADASERRGSGSLSVENSNAANLDNLSLGGTMQCITVDKVGLYTVMTRVFVPKDQRGTGSGGISVAFYAAAECAGAAMIGVGGTSNMVGTTDEWISAPFETEAPSEAMSMSVKLVVLKGFKNPPFKVYFDDVLVKPKD